jgi:sugar phosphate isomerase/epimerase
MKRRQFVSTSALALSAGSSFLATGSKAVAAPAVALTKPAPKVGGFHIGVQCWTFRQFSVMEAIEMNSRAGGTVCEFYPGQKLSPQQPDKKWDHNADADTTKMVREQCEKHGVTPMNYGVLDVPNEEKAARAIFDFAKAWGLHGITTESTGSVDLLEKLAGEYDLKVCYHNHPKKPNDASYKIWDPQYVHDLVKNRHPNLGVCADVGHWITSGLDPLAALQLLKGRIHSTHFKDRAGLSQGTDLIYGRGTFVAAMAQELKTQGFTGNMSVEYETNWDQSLSDVAQCIGYIRGLGASKGW